MVLFLRFFPVALCGLLMGAHAMRSSWGTAASVAFALLPLALAVRRPFVPGLLQLLLAAGALEWLRTAWGYAQAREVLGQPSARLWLILGGVALFYLAAAALLTGARVRRWFQCG